MPGRRLSTSPIDARRSNPVCRGSWFPFLTGCDTEDDVVDEVAVTVVHEIAHHFGIDDAQLHALGWE